MKTKSNCASDGSVTLANGFFGVELYQLGTCFGHLQIIVGEELLFIYLPMLTAVCKFEILCLGCEWEIL